MIFDVFKKNFTMDYLILGSLDTPVWDKDNEIYCFTENEFANVPWINFPGYSNRMNLNTQLMAIQVMYESLNRKEGKYHEVSITYDGNYQGENILRENCVVVYGGKDHVDFMNNADVRKVIGNAEKSSIITMHNHPNNTAASLRDMIIFGGVPKLKLMEIVRPTGNIDILFRHERIPMINEMNKILYKTAPNLKQRQSEDHEEYKKELLDYLTSEETKIIRDEYKKIFKQYGITYIEGVTPENAREADKTLNTDFADSIQRKTELDILKAISKELTPKFSSEILQSDIPDNINNSSVVCDENVFINAINNEEQTLEESKKTGYAYSLTKDNVSVECITEADGSGKLTLDNGNDTITVPFKSITALEGVEVGFIGWTEADVDKASEAIDEVLEQIPGCGIEIAGDEEQEVPEHEELSNDEIEQDVVACTNDEGVLGG